ncbi:hypothetical protein H0H87_002628 [Tephrocybe sp. NHM501043]|nr:hypothetical protein H0H87_002628 [Tephrocybe sp. NHM501043]
MLHSLSNRVGQKDETRGFVWVKSLSATSKVLSYKPFRLESLSHLRTLTIDMTHEGLSTQHPTIAHLISHLEPSNACLNLNSLTLLGLPRIDCLLLKLIAQRFPRLVDLYLSCTERIDFKCCWACFEDSLGCILHSPVPDDYLNAVKMANAFGTALKPLKYLEHLHLGVFLSDDSLLSSHISHVLEEETTPYAIQNWNECQHCFNRLVDDIRRCELEASLVIAQQLRSLKTIGWSSLLAGDTEARVEQHLNSDDTVEDVAERSQKHGGENGGDESGGNVLKKRAQNDMNDRDLKTTIWIQRIRGRVRVRREPW